jgi:hypothetical protein
MRADQLGMVVRARVGEWTAIEVGQGYREAGGRRPLQTKASCARLGGRGRLSLRVCVGDTGDCPDVGVSTGALLRVGVRQYDVRV